ncbi:transcriptional regulator of RNA polII, SAGA, subunit-domain-containing protein [Auriculariales sp. MPI-PUGE-AT-0066]|nr:transcriptional regulator of RNA polII, SAGA, subunit-domain-containing protein [Auriculariales sp. MPI-PUGE-AT-0066]
MRSSSEIKAQLAAELGTNGLPYWRRLSEFLIAKISRAEFEDVIKQYLTDNRLQQLHNALLISIIVTAGSTAPPAAVPLVARERKRRRLRAFQGDEAEASDSLSKRLKLWVVAAGQHERDRMRALALGEPLGDPHAYDEVARPRSIAGVPSAAAGEQIKASRLAATTRGITVQHLQERLNFASQQHGLVPQVPKQAALLLNLALEAVLKKTIAKAISTTTASRAISSIREVAPPVTMLTAHSFATALEIQPDIAVPGASAAVAKLGLGEREFDYSAERDRASWTLGRTRQPPPREDPRWQALAVLRDRSGVRQVLDML